MRSAYYVHEAVQDYIADLPSLGLAEGTQQKYGIYARRLAQASNAVAKERGKRTPMTVAEIDMRVISRYFATSTGHQGNLNNMLVPLRGFLNFCVASDAMDPAVPGRLLAGRKNKKVQRAPKHYVPAEQFDDFLDAGGLRHPSERMTIALFLYTLARRSEVSAIQFKHIDLAKGIINVYREKRDRWTEVGICPELGNELTGWLLAYRDEAGYGGTLYQFLQDYPDYYLVPRLKVVRERDKVTGRLAGVSHISGLDPAKPPVHIERLIKRCLDQLGVVTTRDGKTCKHLGEGCHTIRRSGARAMLKHLSESVGHDRALLQVTTMLDHEDTKDTLTYIGMDEEREQLNTWLKGNSMYGGRPKGGKVIPIRRATA